MHCAYHLYYIIYVFLSKRELESEVHIVNTLFFAQMHKSLLCKKHLSWNYRFPVFLALDEKKLEACYLDQQSDPNTKKIHWESESGAEIKC